MATNVKIFEENSNTNVYIHSMALFCDILYNMDDVISINEESYTCWAYIKLQTRDVFW